MKAMKGCDMTKLSAYGMRDYGDEVSLSKPYTFWADPGHGWLAVPAAEIVALGIEPSAYSYRANGIVYLEEDCDLGLFMRAKGIDPADGPSWFEENVTDRHVDDSEDLPFRRW